VAGGDHGDTVCGRGKRGLTIGTHPSEEERARESESGVQLASGAERSVRERGRERGA
jgi:hypothetical protein